MTGFARFLLGELRPKGKVVTPFNVITGAIMAVAAVLLVIRFTQGLGAVGNHHGNPWGLWVGFNVVTGVAMAGGAYVVCFMVYVLNMHKYHGIVRATVLFGFLSYVFYAGALVLDVGRPWNMINPIIGNNFGLSSILFLVAWHFMLYMAAQFLEFSPTVAEWANWRRLRRILGSLTLGAVIFGITLSVLHQSGLGALFLMAKPKIHPLWYNEFIPITFLVSSIFSGLGVVIIIEWVSNRIFRAQTSETNRKQQNAIAFGLARVSVGAMFVYLFMLILTFIHGHNWVHVGTPMFTWYLVEVLGFVVVPLALFMHGLFERRVNVVRGAAVAAVAGVMLNRINVALVAFNWNVPHRYVPTWMEIVISISVICVQLWAYRWIVLRMPVRRESPAWVAAQELERAPAAEVETGAATKAV